MRFAVGVQQGKWPGSVKLHAIYFGLVRSFFTGQKILFLHDKHEEFLVEKISFILCTFVYLRCYGRLKYRKIQCTNGIENIVYFTRVFTNERKFSWRWNIVAELLQGMKNNLWKNESKIIFRCLVRALWKCTKKPNRNYAN